MPDAPAVIGVDGCPGGRIGAQVEVDGRVRWHILPLYLDVGQLAKEADAVAVDIPIGLPTSGQRMAALRNVVDVAAALDEAPARIPLDDMLDALACAWTARRWALGAADSLPDEGEEYDARGLRMRIVA